MVRRSPSTSRLPVLLMRGEPPQFDFRRGNGAARLLLVCDHASRRVPKALADLGLADEYLARHLGWDIGAATVTRSLSRRLDASALLAGYSRLVIDCNRDPTDVTSIPVESDGVAIPGNRDLTPAQRAARHAALFMPYHAAITGWIDAALAAGHAPALVAIHSFTPSMAGVVRPWHVGILWDGDARMSAPLLAVLRSDSALVVGDNEPYSARQPAGFTLRHHAFARDLPHVAIEIRQDLIAERSGAESWAKRLAAALGPILADPATRRAASR